jgi:hypothetical protein
MGVQISAVQTPLIEIFAVVVIGGIAVGLWKYFAKDARAARRAKKDAKDLEDFKKAKKDVTKKLGEVKQAAAPVDPPAPVALPAPPNSTQENAGFQTIQEFPIGQKLGIEFSRIVEGNHKRVIQSRGTADIKFGRRGGNDFAKFFFIFTKQGGYYINPRKIIKVTTNSKRLGRGATETVSYKLVFDVLYGESLNQDGTITWDEELELILADSGLDQYVAIAAYEAAFQLTPTLKKVMMIVGFLAFLIGLAINGADHVVPTTIVHWVP